MKHLTLTALALTFGGASVCTAAPARSNAVMRVEWTADGALASLVAFWFSRKREFAADAGSANLLGTPNSMIAALRRLGNLKPGVLPDSLKAMGIAGKRGTSIWSTHPSLEDRIEALNRWGSGAV